VPYHLKINTRPLSLIIEAGISSLETIFSYSLFASSGASISVVQAI
jgi:ABC-type transport system involved in Fe-S cluster assembly fused permease/ATPase subunit